MSNIIGLGKAYRIIRNINCGICCFCVLFSGIAIARMFGGLASSAQQAMSFPFFVIALYGIYKLEKRNKVGIFLLLAGEIIGGLLIGSDPEYPEDKVFSLILFGAISILQVLSIDWKSFLNFR